MVVAAHIRRQYPSVEAFSATSAAEDRLVQDHFLVVVDEGRYRGILTAADIAESPRKLVVDCLHPLPSLALSDSLHKAVELMRATKRLVLPVLQEECFEGVVTYCDLAEHLSEENSSLQSEVAARAASLDQMSTELSGALENQEQTQRELRLKEAALDGALNGIAIGDEDTVVSYANKSFAQMWGLPDATAIIGKPIVSFFRDPEEARRAAVQTKERGRFSGVLEAVRPDGFRFLVEVDASAIRTNGDGDLHLMASFMDVTDRERTNKALEESEQRYRTLVESAPWGVTVLLDGRYAYVNHTRVRMAGGRTKEDLLGCGLEDVAVSAHTEAIRHAIDKILRTGGVGPVLEVQLKRADGSFFDARVTGAYIEYEGRPAVLAFTQDITEEKRFAQQQREQEARLRQADKMASLGTLVAGVAHEINNPNTSILGDVNNLKTIWDHLSPILMQHQQQNPDAAIGTLSFSEVHDELPEILGGIRGSCLRIDHIVQRLKDFSRPSHEASVETVCLNDVVETVLKLARKYAERASTEVETALVHPPALILGDQQNLEHACLNLVLNACDALTDRTQRIAVRTEVDASRGQALLIVQDEGRGIAEGDLARVFDPFFTTKRARGGTGLGLSIVNSIVQEHGGRVDVDSTPGHGTTFTIRLPLAGEDGG